MGCSLSKANPDFHKRALYFEHGELIGKGIKRRYKTWYKAQNFWNLKKTICNHDRKFIATVTLGPYSKKNVLSQIGLLFKEWERMKAKNSFNDF